MNVLTTRLATLMVAALAVPVVVADNTNVVAINVNSADGGKTLGGTMTYSSEGPIGFKGALRDGGNSGSNYSVENQWGGDSAPWNPGGNWVIGARGNQLVVGLDVKSDDNGASLNGTNTYAGRRPDWLQRYAWQWFRLSG
ncbi:MAG: hypothetical protein R3E89_01755 [Thiolinea sp.]